MNESIIIMNSTDNEEIIRNEKILLECIKRGCYPILKKTKLLKQARLKDYFGLASPGAIVKERNKLINKGLLKFNSILQGNSIVTLHELTQKGEEVLEKIEELIEALK
ncbi:hypothetical protein DRN58_08495 [Thermococci archaeon]|nr:MAG: hypothetical protein DRN58_08495 [Thermococci archaeon]